MAKVSLGDFSVSCPVCGLTFTWPLLKDRDLHRYAVYKSEAEMDARWDMAIHMRRENHFVAKEEEKGT